MAEYYVNCGKIHPYCGFFSYDEVRKIQTVLPDWGPKEPRQEATINGWHVERSPLGFVHIHRRDEPSLQPISLSRETMVALIEFLDEGKQ